MTRSKTRFSTSSPIPALTLFLGVILSIGPMLWRVLRRPFHIYRIAKEDTGLEFFIGLFTWSLLLNYFIFTETLDETIYDGPEMRGAYEVLELVQSPFLAELLALFWLVIFLISVWPAVYLWNRFSDGTVAPSAYWSLLIGLQALTHLTEAALHPVFTFMQKIVAANPAEHYENMDLYYSLLDLIWLPLMAIGLWNLWKTDQSVRLPAFIGGVVLMSVCGSIAYSLAFGVIFLWNDLWLVMMI